MLHQKKDLAALPPHRSVITPAYSHRSLRQAIPKYEMPSSEMAPGDALNLIRDELMLDGHSRLNLATFVTTWMEPEARELMNETFDKNMIDKDEYPQTAEIEMRCVNMLSRLWNSPDHESATGCSTIGSSEAAMLAGLALKWNWRTRQRALGRSIDRPNLVMGANVQVCWLKFCRYFDVEPRLVPCEGERFTLTGDEAVARIDENTIGVVAIMGSTFDGAFEPIEEIHSAVAENNAASRLETPLHVDAASGGFIAPFLHADRVWDFRLPLVQSINASGHKYGLVYPGVGWVVWRDAAHLPNELVFHCSYLGGDLPNFALNFSRPGNQVLAQYYNFLRLGRDGYRRIHQASQEVALHLSSAIAEMGPFRLISDGSHLPVFCWTLREEASFSLYDLAPKLRERGWLVPAYPMPANREDLVVQRIVVREGFSRDLADLLIEDIRRAIAHFREHPAAGAATDAAQFHHA